MLRNSQKILITEIPKKIPIERIRFVTHLSGFGNSQIVILRIVRYSFVRHKRMPYSPYRVWRLFLFSVIKRCTNGSIDNVDWSRIVSILRLLKFDAQTSGYQQFVRIYVLCQCNDQSSWLWQIVKRLFVPMVTHNRKSWILLVEGAAARDIEFPHTLRVHEVHCYLLISMFTYWVSFFFFCSALICCFFVPFAKADVNGAQ